MDQSPASPIVGTPAHEESSALEALKTKLPMGVKCPPLTLAVIQEIDVYTEAFPQSQESLAEKLRIDRSYLSQILKFAKLPPEAQIGQDGRTLSSWEIKKQLRTRPPQSSAKASTDLHSNLHKPPQNGTSGTLGQNNEYKAEQDLHNGNPRGPAVEGPLSTGYTLIRDSVNGLTKFLWWVKDAHFGELAVRWLIYFGSRGWLMISVTVIVLGFTLVGAYQTTTYVHSNWGDFWWRFRTAAFHSQAPSDSGHAAPRVVETRPIDRHRLLMKWTAVPGALKYRVYWHSPDNHSIQPLDQDVEGLGAVLDVSPVMGEGYLSVTALSAGNNESPHSDRFGFIPNGENNTNSVSPLPVEEQGNQQTAASQNGSQPKSRPTNGAASGSLSKKSTHLSPPVRTAAVPDDRSSGQPTLAPSLPAPVDIHAEVRTPDLIRLTWRAVGPGVTYNAYSSASGTLTPLRKENTHPLKSNVVDWTPETGLERYWVVVTAVDAQGHESPYSEAIEVVRHPEKSGSNGLMDAAAGTVRKYLPW